VDQYTDTGDSDEKLSSWKIGKVDENGDQATVPAQLKSNKGNTQTIDFSTTKEDGKWLICGVDADTSGDSFSEGDSSAGTSTGSAQGDSSDSNGSDSGSGSSGGGKSGVAVAPAGTSSPKSVVNAFLTAAKKHDSAAAKKLVCSSLQDDITDFGSDDGDSESVDSWTIGDVDQNGDQADVPVVMKSNQGSTASVTFETSKEDGKWLVCGVDLPDSDDSGSGSDSGSGYATPSDLRSFGH